MLKNIFLVCIKKMNESQKEYCLFIYDIYSLLVKYYMSQGYCEKSAKGNAVFFIEELTGKPRGTVLNKISAARKHIKNSDSYRSNIMYRLKFISSVIKNITNEQNNVN